MPSHTDDAGHGGGGDTQPRRVFLKSLVGWVACPVGETTRSRRHGVERLVRQGVRLFEREEYRPAVGCFSAALAIDPCCRAAHRHRADGYMACHDYRPAVADLSAAIRLDPADPSAFDARAVAHAMLGEDREAVADRTAIIRLDPTGFNFYMRGVCALFHDPLLAVADFTEAIRRTPGHANAYLLRGTAHEALGRFGPAVADYAQAMRLNPATARCTAEDLRRVRHKYREGGGA